MFYFVVSVKVIFSNSLIFVFCFDSVTQCQRRLSRWCNWPFKSWAVMRNKLRTENWDLRISWSLFWFDQLRHSAKRLEFRKFANNFYGYYFGQNGLFQVRSENYNNRVNVVSIFCFVLILLEENAIKWENATEAFW